jgi:Oxidoreductase family, NAD-binding Rossmann fold
VAVEAREYRVGPVGCGQVAAGFHIPAVAGHPRTKLVAMADVDPARAAEYASWFGAEGRYASHEEMLARAALDLVIVATRPAVTPVIAADCLRAGTHVLCKKPIATDRWRKSRLRYLLRPGLWQRDDSVRQLRRRRRPGTRPLPGLRSRPESVLSTRRSAGLLPSGAGLLHTG